MELIKDTSLLKKAIKSIGTRGANLDADIQTAAVSVLAHVEAHGDTTCADLLVNAMPKSARKLALVEFMLAFGMLVTLKADSKDNKAAIAAGRVFQLDRSKATNIDGAIEKPWYEFRKEAAVSEVFDAQSQVKALLSRLSAAVTDGKEIKGRVEALAQAKELVAALEG